MCANFFLPVFNLIHSLQSDTIELHNYIQSDNQLVMAIRVYRVAVVGCPRAIISSSGLYEGAGKSCLCNRFVRPEAYVESHNSCLSEDQWLNEPVTNGDHFIYWGAATKHLPDGSKARFQVVEQTELYGTVDHALHAHPSSQDYLARASATHFKTSGGGKTAVRYKAVESGVRRIRGPTRNTQLFPNEDFAEKGLGVYGYVCVFDPSLEGKQMENQLSYWSILMPLLAKRKRKIVVACVKCDTVDEVKITFASSVVSHVLKKSVPFVEVSARESVNVEEAFFAIANPAKRHKPPKNGKRPLSNYITFNKVLESRKGDLNRAKDAYRSLLQKCVTHFSTTWNEVLPGLERDVVYRTVLELAGAEGEEMVLKMFQLRLIEIKLSEASKLHGHSASKMVDRGNSRTYQDYLSSAFKGHPDLGSESLYDYVYSPRSSISDMSDVLTEPSLPSSYRNTPDLLHNSRTNIHLSNLALSDTRPRSSTFQELSNQNAELFPSSTLPRTPPRNKTLSVDFSSPQRPYTVEDPPPLPPRALDVFASSQLKILSQSQSFMGRIPEASLTQESDIRRLSNSMDCLLVDSDTDSVKKKRFDELVAEPYLQPVEVQEMMSLTPSLLSSSPKPTDTAKSASIFMSMRVRTKSRPALPKQTTIDVVQTARSVSFQKGHKRSRSNPWVLEGSRTKPPELPPRNTEATIPIPIVPPTPTPVSTSSSVFSETVMSPLETSLEFCVRPPLPATPKNNAVRSPAMLKSKKTSDEGGTDELDQSEGEGLEVSESPSPRRQIIDDDDDDDDPDDPSNQYARIEDMQKYVLMSSAPSTLPKASSVTTVGDADTVDFRMRSQTLGRPHKDLPSATSAPLLPWKRKWKKQRDAPVIHDATPVLAPSATTVPQQSPSHSKRVSRPLPPSPTKPRRLLSNKGTGNIYEAIDDYRRHSSKKQQDHLWGPPVEARLVEKYMEAVRRLFTLPDVKERWINTLTSIMPEENIDNIPYPFAPGVGERDPGSEHSTPSPQPKLRHKSSFSTADDVIIIQQPNPVTPIRSSFAASPPVPIHSSFAASPPLRSSFAASPPTRSSFAASPPMSPFRNPPQSIRVVQSPDQRQFKKSSSRDDLIQILNQQLNHDSLSSDSDSDDESSSSDEDSDIEPSPVVKATTPLLQTDLDEALSLRASVSTDSDLANPPTSNGVETVNNVRPSMLIKKRGTSKRRTFDPSSSEGTRNLSDSGISNCHSQTFEDGFSPAVQSSLAQHNSESEC